jgi:hypothetical protein
MFVAEERQGGKYESPVSRTSKGINIRSDEALILQSRRERDEILTQAKELVISVRSSKAMSDQADVPRYVLAS